MMGERIPEIRSSSVMKLPLHQNYPYLPSVIFSSLKASTCLSFLSLILGSFTIFYAGSLFCHMRFMVFLSYQDYYPLFFLFLKNTTHKWADIFSALSCPSRASRSYSTLSPSTHLQASVTALSFPFGFCRVHSTSSPKVISNCR